MAEEGRADNRSDGGRGRLVLEALPPPVGELAAAILLGACLHALVDLGDVVVSQPWRGQVGLRLRQVAFAALAALGLGGAMAAPLYALAAASRRRRSWGWLSVYAAFCVVAMEAVLGTQLRRQATSLLDGRVYALLLPLYVVLCGLAVPAAHLLGAAAARAGKWVSLTLGLSLGGLIAGHVILRDDYPAVHLAILWVAAILGGASLAPWLSCQGPMRWGWVWGGALALVAWLVSPDDAVRLALFGEPGAVAPFVLAQVAWRPVPGAEGATAPAVVAHPPAVMERARLGVPDEPLVVLLSVDALRGDVVASGRFDDQLPQLARLRDEGVFFTRATAPGSQTSVTLTSVFAGRYFSQLRWAYFSEGRTRFHYAAEDPTERFPARLSEAGVGTHSFLALTFLSGRFGVARGFSDERSMVTGRRHGTAAEVMPALIDAVEKRGAGPSFFFAHLMEPHEPYDRGAVDEGPAFERYLSEVAVVDHWLRRLVVALRRHHRDRGYLVVTADHGEAFGEHGTRFHTKTLYQELIAVPLILHGPGLLPRRIDERVTLIDLGPTISHLFGVEPPPGQMGISLLPLARGIPSVATRPVVAEGRLRRAMFRGDLKVIEDTVRQTVEGYDLGADPHELHNLFDDGHPEAAELLGEMRAFFAAHRIPGYEPPYKP